MKYPSIKITLNGYMACNLLGKAEIIATFFKKADTYFIVKAITPMLKKHESLTINRCHVHVAKVGYLVYFSTGVAAWFELISFDDERFSKYEDEL